MWKKASLIGVIVIGTFIAYPVDFSPQAYHVDVEQHEGVPAQKLAPITYIGEGVLHNAEDVAIDSNGDIFTVSEDGMLYQLLSQEASSTQKADVSNAVQVKPLFNIGGRALGLAFDANDKLIICDSENGLLRIDIAEQSVEILTQQAGGMPINFADDVAIAADGRIFFSDATQKYHLDNYKYDLIEAHPTGRLLMYNPADNSTHVLMEGLFFANGVALAADESFVLVNETFASKTTRYWLTGEKAGQHDTFVSGLAGYPDGIASGGTLLSRSSVDGSSDDGSNDDSNDGQDGFWLTLAAPRNMVISTIHPYPFLKKLAFKIPQAWWPKPKKMARLIHLNTAGEIDAIYADETGELLSFVTSVEEYDGALYLGLLGDSRYIARMDLP